MRNYKLVYGIYTLYTDSQKELAEKIKDLIKSDFKNDIAVYEIVPDLNKPGAKTLRTMLETFGKLWTINDTLNISKSLLDSFNKFCYKKGLNVKGYIYSGVYKILYYIIDIEYGIDDYMILYDISKHTIHRCKIHSSNKGSYINLYKCRIYSDNWIRLD